MRFGTLLPAVLSMFLQTAIAGAEREEAETRRLLNDSRADEIESAQEEVSYLIQSLNEELSSESEECLSGSIPENPRGTMNPCVRYDIRNDGALLTHRMIETPLHVTAMRLSSDEPLEEALKEIQEAVCLVVAHQPRLQAAVRTVRVVPASANEILDRGAVTLESPVLIVRLEVGTGRTRFFLKGAPFYQSGILRAWEVLAQELHASASRITLPELGERPFPGRPTLLPLEE